MDKSNDMPKNKVGNDNTAMDSKGGGYDSAVYIADSGEYSDSKKVELTGYKPHPNNILQGNGIDHTLVASKETVTLSWKNVNAYVTPQNRMCCIKPDPNIPTKRVLRDVYGHVNPGTLLAIIGASGAGKTSLLNILTNRTNNKTLSVSGEIRVNGVDVGSGIRNISAYVQQDDLFISTMTVKEHLRFRALLRMERELPEKARLQRVEAVMTELGLTKCANNMIGDPSRNMKGISGGEMRRLSFASEILTNPPLLFCDEPTSGLDSFMAESIIQTLKTLVDNEHKTIVCTIHQPSSEVFALFNKVLIMSEGRVAFMGSSDEALEFYKSVGFPCPNNFNPADFFIKTMAVVPEKEKECRGRIEVVCDKFSQSQYRKAITADTERACGNPKKAGVIYEEAFSNTSRYEAPFYRQFGAVFMRCWKTTIRDALVLRVRLIQTVVMSLALGLIFLQLDNDQEGVMDINGALFLIIINITMTNLFGVLNSFPSEVPVFLRDYSNGLYRVDVYFFSKSLAELPGSLFIPFLYSSIVYWMIGLYDTATAFFLFVAIVLIVATASISLGYAVSAGVNSTSTALAIAPPLVVPLIMFGGFFLNSDSIPVYFIWLEYVSFFKYANELLVINQWENVDSIDCSAGSRCLFNNGTEVIEYLNFDTDNKTLDLVLLLVIMAAFRILAFIILFIKARRSRQ